MNEREEGICDAALRMFVRYGIARTSMNDIAREAGVARQTLYNRFPNKDAVLLATIRLFTDRAINEIELGLSKRVELSEQLNVVFEHLARRPYAMLHSSPHAEDVIEGVSAESRRAITESNDRFRTVIEKVLAPSEEEIRASEMSVHQLADAIRHFASAAKHQARDQAQLEELLESLTIMVLSCTERGSGNGTIGQFGSPSTAVT